MIEIDTIDFLFVQLEAIAPGSRLWPLATDTPCDRPPSDVARLVGNWGADEVHELKRAHMVSVLDYDGNILAQYPRSALGVLYCDMLPGNDPAKERWRPLRSYYLTALLS